MNFRRPNSIVAELLLIASLLTAAPAVAGEWNIVTSAGKSITNWHGQAATQVVNLDRIQWRWRGFDLGAGVAPYFVRQPKSWFSDDYGDGNETIVGGSVHAVARKRWRQQAAVQPYFELVGGPLWTPKQVPDSTSQLNWVTDIGGGVSLSASPQSRVALLAGYRFSHISNGGLSSRNPGWNVSSIVLGVRVR
jgi:hypothetical protein